MTRLPIAALAVTLLGCDPFGSLPSGPTPPFENRAPQVATPDRGPSPDVGTAFLWPTEDKVPAPPSATLPQPPDDPTSPCIAGYEQVLPSQQTICRPLPGYPAVADGVSMCRFGKPELVVGNVALCPNM
jgi:hypothetical protein